MTNKALRALSIACAAGTVVLAVCPQAQAAQAYREPRWSLAPRLTPFPCHAVTIEGNSITFRESLVLVCQGEDELEMPAGSLMGINFVCNGTSAILHHNFDEKGGLFDVVRRSCGRVDRRPPRQRR